MSPSSTLPLRPKMPQHCGVNTLLPLGSLHSNPIFFIVLLLSFVIRDVFFYALFIPLAAALMKPLWDCNVVLMCSRACPLMLFPLWGKATFPVICEMFRYFVAILTTNIFVYFFTASLPSILIIATPSLGEYAVGQFSTHNFVNYVFLPPLFPLLLLALPPFHL